MDTIRIFIVDDNAAARQMLLNILSTQEDFEVVGESGTGQGGIIMLEEASPHVVILEASVSGGMSVAEVTQEIKSIYPEVKVVVSADALSMQNHVAGNEHMFDDFISKPYNKPRICRAIREAVRR